MILRGLHSQTICGLVHQDLLAKFLPNLCASVHLKGKGGHTKCQFYLEFSFVHYILTLQFSKASIISVNFPHLPETFAQY